MNSTPTTPDNSTVADRDLVFYMQVYGDHELAARALKRVRFNYPESRLIVVSDGDDSVPGHEIGEQFRAEFFLGENLHGIEHGGRMFHRILTQYLSAPGHFLICMDTDARMDRRFRYFPSGHGVFGSLGTRNGAVQGGCYVVSHSAAVQLHDSEIYRSEILLDPHRSWGPLCRPDLFDDRLRQGDISDDKVFFWGLREIGIPRQTFDEIYSIWKPTPANLGALANREKIYAVVHPDKRMN